MKYHLYYFSATGNTAHSAELIGSALTREGHEVQTVSLNTKTRPLTEAPDRIVIAFPVLSARPPGLVMRFIDKLPRPAHSGAVKAAVLAVSGGGPFNAAGTAAQRLKRRGYDVFLASGISYPENWSQIVEPPEEKECRIKTDNGISETGEFIRNLISEKPQSDRRTVPAFFMNMAGVLFQFIGRRFLGKLFIADNDCTSCGLCKRTCPAGVISMKKHSKPYWNFSCENCNRCINICPEKAINTSTGRLIFFITAVGTLLVTGIILYSRIIRPLYSGFPQAAETAVNIIGYGTVVVLAHILSLTLLDKFLITPLQRLGFVPRFFQNSYTKTFRRYTFKGYKPPVENIT